MPPPLDAAADAAASQFASHAAVLSLSAATPTATAIYATAISSAAAAPLYPSFAWASPASSSRGTAASWLSSRDARSHL